MKAIEGEKKKYVSSFPTCIVIHRQMHTWTTCNIVCKRTWLKQMPCNSSKPGNYVHVGYRQRISQFVKYCAFFFSSAHNCYSHPATSVLFIHNHDSGAHTVHVLHVHEPSEMHTVSNSLQRSSEVDTLKTVSRRRGGRKSKEKKDKYSTGSLPKEIWLNQMLLLCTTKLTHRVHKRHAFQQEGLFQCQQ